MIAWYLFFFGMLTTLGLMSILGIGAGEQIALHYKLNIYLIKALGGFCGIWIASKGIMPIAQNLPLA